MRSLSLLAVLAVLAIALTGCPPQRPAPEPEEARVDAQHVDQVIASMDLRLDDARSDVDRVEERAAAVEAGDAEILQEQIREMRADADYLERRLAQPDTATVDQWRTWRQGIQSDLAALEGRVDRALIDTAPDRATLESDARERLSDIRALIAEVPDAERRRALEQLANDLEQDIAAIAQAGEEALGPLRTDIGSALEALRADIGRVDLFERLDPAPAQNGQAPAPAAAGGY